PTFAVEAFAGSSARGCRSGSADLGGKCFGGGPCGRGSGTIAAMSDLRMLAPLYQPAEETGGSWHTRVHPGNSPQGGRDALAHHFLKEEAAAGGDQERAREFADAANLM